MWLLVFINLVGTQVDAVVLSEHRSMYECFEEREEFIPEGSAEYQRPQFICLMKIE